MATLHRAEAVVIGSGAIADVLVQELIPRYLSSCRHGLEVDQSVACQCGNYLVITRLRERAGHECRRAIMRRVPDQARLYSSGPQAPVIIGGDAGVRAACKAANRDFLSDSVISPVG